MRNRATKPSLAVRLYRKAAELSAKSLHAVGATESIAVRRSAATGEVVFPFSDIDLLAVLTNEAASSGELLARLYQRLRWCAYAIPRLKHLDVQSRQGLLQLADMDSFWASMERRSIRSAAGQPPEIPARSVRPEDAVARFGLWTEWFFPRSLQLKSARNIRKTALECWNAYAVAEGLFAEPELLRSRMEDQVTLHEPALATERLHDAAYASSFVFSLAGRLHDRRLPALERLAAPVMFEAITAPLSLRRLFVVVPSPATPLPEGAVAQGAWPCTPELLHLYVTFKNPFLYWALPQELTRLGIEIPSESAFLKACRYYGHERFLTTPGFAAALVDAQASRLDCVERTLAAIQQGAAPRPVSDVRLEGIKSGHRACVAYYRDSYDSLRDRTLRLQDVAYSLS